MLSTSVQAKGLEYNPKAKGMLEIHQETLARDIRILVAQGAIIVRKRAMSWQIVGI